MTGPGRDDLPPPFAELRERFREAAAREIAVERRVGAHRRRSRRKVVAALVVALFVPAAGVAGAGWLRTPEDPVDAGQKLDIAVADAGIVPSSAVPDPDGGPPWALKVFTDRRGQDCVAHGRLQDGKLGRYSGGNFYPHPDRIPGTCGDLARDPVMFVMSEHPRQPARTLAYGLSRDRRPVTLEIRGRRHVLRPGALGAFLFVAGGRLPRQSVTVSWRDGDRTVRFRAP